MKTMRKLTCSILVLFIVHGFISDIFAQAKDLQKTYTWRYNINKDAKVIFDNYDCDLVIHTWDRGETEYRMMIDASARTNDDATRLTQYLEDYEFSHSAASVTFRNRFWQSRRTIMGRMTMDLKGEKNISLTEFTMKGELWIPEGCTFQLNSKYSGIEIEDFSGRFYLDLYNDKLYGVNVNGNAEIAAKYSTIEFSDMKDVRADFYDTDFEAANTGILKIKSKYSKVTVKNSGNIDIDSYDDKYNLNITGDVNFISKYSDLSAEASEVVKLDCYDGSVIIGDVKDIDITSKYVDFQFATAGNCSFTSSYDDKLIVKKLNSLNISKSRYSSFKIEELIGSLSEADGYDDKFTINKTGSFFKELKINGKYVDASLGLPKTTNYRFRANIKYPELDIDESEFKTRIKILESSQLEYDAVKGTEKEGMPLIEVNGYDMSLKIIEI
jgi:hypothetical protein